MEPSKDSPLVKPFTNHYQTLHQVCGAVLTETLNNQARIAILGEVHDFLSEIEIWTSSLPNKREKVLFERALIEYQLGILAVCQGCYHHGFKGLRLVLELILQGVYLSAYAVELSEWIGGERDTIWSTLVGTDGVLSERFAKAFFPDLSEHVNHFNSLAKKVYRECSEAVHGNIPKQIIYPNEITFSQAAFADWTEMARIVALICSFSLALRYLNEVENIAPLETHLMNRIGHIEPIRLKFGAIGGRQDE